MAKKLYLEEYLKPDEFGTFYTVRIVDEDKIEVQSIEDINEINLSGIKNQASENFLLFLQQELGDMLMRYSEKDNAVKAQGLFAGRLDCLLHIVNNQLKQYEREE